MLVTDKSKGYDFFKHNSHAHLDLPRLENSIIKLQFFALYVEGKYKETGFLKRCLKMLDSYNQVIEKSNGLIKTILNKNDLKNLMKNDYKGALLSLEGGEALEGELAVLRALFQLGIRSLGLTWNLKNELASGVNADEEGLTRFGKKVVTEMNNLGMLVDLAHLNSKGFFDVISISNKPLIVSHANAKKLCDHPRNLTDEQLKNIKNINGVVGLVFYPPFISSENASLDKLLDHFEYIADLIGVDHIGFGSDFDGINKVIQGLEDISCFTSLIDKLKTRGFNSGDIDKITSKNYLRLLSDVLPQN